MTRLELDLGSIGRVTVDGDDPRDIIQAAEFWRSLPDHCPECGAPVEVRYQRITAKTGQNYGKSFDYYRVRCKGATRHEATLGQHQDGTGLFYREKGEWTTYTPGGGDYDDGLDSYDEPAPARQAAPQRQQPSGRAPVAAAPAKRPPTPPQPTVTENGQPAGLALRAALATKYKIPGVAHQALANYALSRDDIIDWLGLNDDECLVIRDAAAAVAAGRLSLDSLARPDMTEPPRRAAR